MSLNQDTQIVIEKYIIELFRDEYTSYRFENKQKIKLELLKHEKLYSKRLF